MSGDQVRKLRSSAGGRQPKIVEVAPASVEASPVKISEDPAPEPAAPQSPAEAAAAFRAKAQGYAIEALEQLNSLVKSASSEAVRVSAANALIDRAHGRPAPAAKTAGEDSDDGQGAKWTVQWLDPEKP